VEGIFLNEVLGGIFVSGSIPVACLWIALCFFIFGWHGIRFHGMNGDAYQGNGDEEWMHTTNDMEDEMAGVE
jgi:hypothetical protein